MVGGVFTQQLTSAGNPAAQDTKNNSCDGENHKNQKNRLMLVEVKQIAHPNDHGCEKLTDLRKQRSDNRSRRSLKSSSLHKKFMVAVTDGAAEPT